MRPLGILLLLLVAIPATASIEVIVYPAFGTGARTAIEGRVIAIEARSEAAADDSGATNLRRSLKSLMNDEQAFVPVTVGIGRQRWSATTDAEGYFQLSIVELDAMTPGWHEVTAMSGSFRGVGSLLLVPAGDVHGIVSDFDDTVVVSEVNNKRKLLQHSLMRNFMQREAVPGAPELYARIAENNPGTLFYLSASPRQLQSAIQSFLDHHRFPRGVLLTKKITNDSSGDSLHDQIAYKTGKLVDIFERLPHVSFTLIGDDGESDPEIYQALQQRYPARVKAIWIRRVHPDPQRVRIEGQGDLQEQLNPN
ncbi:phosphatase domain-containing protein [Povalibacter sp.]|uniref:phosphatase domain-containing protein n=1 Tax=Povalibacter sp. TaxID=1962978 RepID=UPI002F4292EF